MLTKYRCAICGGRLEEGRYVFSRFTRNRYCIDLAKHDRLARKRRRQRRETT